MLKWETEKDSPEHIKVAIKAEYSRTSLLKNKNSFIRYNFDMHNI
jgi:hypothetical protein